jgi:hypothetical protein
MLNELPEIKMQEQDHRVFSIKKEPARDQVDQHIEIACPSSTVLRSLERYFRVHGILLELPIPLKEGADPEVLAVVKNVTVEVKAHPSTSFRGRYDDRLEIRWHSARDLRLSFVGRFTIRPLGAGTELTLKGKYDAPFLALQNMFQSLFDESAAQVIARALLERLKSVLETSAQLRIS